MAETEKSMIQQIYQVFNAIPPAKKISFGLMITIVVGGFIALMMWTNQPDFQVLFANLDTADAGRVMDKLKEKRVPFEIKQGGSAVMVPNEMVYELRLELAGEGIPKGKNVGFEIFDEMGFGTTEFVQRLKYQQAIQGELARTIMGFDAVENARVHIVSAGDSLFAEDEKPATASVVLRLNGSRALNNQQLQGIINLVARAVEGLKPENITVVDMAGGLLSKGQQENDVASLSKNQFEYRQKMEKDLERRIQTMLEPIIGLNKVMARVSAELDFGKVSIIEEKYDPDSITVRSEQRQKESSSKGDSLPTGSPDLQTQSEGSNSGSGFAKENSIINYEINKINKQITNSVGDIKRLSAAVIIDGPYVTEKGAEGGDVKKFVPRDKKEMKNFEDIIKKAIGFNESRGDQVNVSNISFAIDKTGEVVFQEQETSIFDSLRKISKPLINVALIIVFFLLAIRPFKKWLSRTGDYIETMAISAGEEVKQLAAQAESEPNSMSELRELKPDATAKILSSWINEES